MKTAIGAALIAVIMCGCASKTGNIVTAEMVFRHGTNEVRISQPKDTSFEDLMVSPSDGTIRVKKYRSTANEAAIASAEKQAEAQAAMFGAMIQSARDMSDAYMRMNGIPVQPRQPVSTNTAAK